MVNGAKQEVEEGEGERVGSRGSRGSRGNRKSGKERIGSVLSDTDILLQMAGATISLCRL